MQDNYWVQVDWEDSSTDRWEYLSRDQANAVYAEQVEIHGRRLTTTGRM